MQLPATGVPMDCCRQCRQVDGCDSWEYSGPPRCSTVPQRCSHATNHTWCASDPAPGQCQLPPRKTCPPCDPKKPFPVPKNDRPWHPTCHFMHGRHALTASPSSVSGSCTPPANPPHPIDCVAGKCVRFDRGSDTATAAALARASDVAVVFVATTSSEGSDRHSLNLDDNGNALVTAVAAANPNTVVVAATPGALLTPWRDAVKSLLVNFMPGQEGGNAITQVLFGKVNPSGKPFLRQNLSLR